MQDVQDVKAWLHLNPGSPVLVYFTIQNFNRYGESGMRAFLSKKVLLFLWIVVIHIVRGKGRLDPPRKVFRLDMHFCT